MPTVKRTSRKMPFNKRKVDVNQSDSQGRTQGNKDRYNAWSWRKYSIARRKRYRRCQGECGLLFPNYKDLVTDHIIPINEEGSFDDERNHQSMCKSCHSVKSGKERHGFIEDWTINNKGERIPKRSVL